MPFNPATARQLLKEFNFTTLFIQQLGWDNHKSTLAVTVADETFSLSTVAHKRGMAVFVCPAIPPHNIRAKIDQQVAKSAHEHIIIYHDTQRTRQIWQWVKREPGKPIARREHLFHRDQPGDSLIQKLKQCAFSLDEEEELTLTGVTRRTRASFDLERVTKRFFDRFKDQHAKFLAFISGIPDQELQRWYASVMLNRMMFVYFIQRKGYLDGDTDYLRNRLERTRQACGKDKFYSFYRHFLLRLFHEGLGGKARSSELEKLLGRIPYLNGGIFDKHEIEKRFPDIKIPDEAFIQIFDYFDDYQWHLDERPLRADNEINPDVLGYIFEKYINQKQMGAYYTKEDITEYIGKNTILPFLLDAVRAKCKIAFEKCGTGVSPVSSDRGTGVPPVVSPLHGQDAYATSADHGQDAHATTASVWNLLKDNPDRYIYEAVRRGVVAEDGSVIPESALPDFVQKGMHDPKARMFEKRYNLGQAELPVPDGNNLALPTETWREYASRRQRCLDLRTKLASGEVHEVNDLITYNLDIRQFAQDVIENSEGPELLRAFWHALEHVSVLDPTCGSGAFLFAALSILEPLYEACLDRMAMLIEERGTGVPPVVSPLHGQVAHATSAEHGQDAHATLHIRQGAYLPHWTKDGATYAVTFRLADSLPASVLTQWLEERDDIMQRAEAMQRPLSIHEEQQLHELHSERVEKYLDAGAGKCHLLDPRVAAMVQDALRAFHGQRYDLIAWCIMPNHVHVVVRPRPGHDLPDILHSWKSFSAKQANRIVGRRGTFWQAESYDHLLRDEYDFCHAVQYILDNPRKAGLQDWKWCGTSGTGVPPVSSASGTGVPPVVPPLHGQDAHATSADHGQDAHATLLADKTSRYIKFHDFRDILDRMAQHPSARYFIFKSIILNNLYGVDIMEEAVEICRLRLFLKLAAQVEPDPSKDNLGIEPLPDIDFNIKAGNTLVGYATYDDVKKAVTGELDFDNSMARIQQKAEEVERLFALFKKMQTEEGMDAKVFVEAKQQLRKQLATLEDELNRYLAKDYGIDNKNKADYAKWLASHQPFHWFIEFYGMMNAGGFDVIIGNPPWVEFAKLHGQYGIIGFSTLACNNLWAFVVERSSVLLHKCARTGLIVPMSLVCTERMIAVQQVVKSLGSSWLSNVESDSNPGQLFDGVKQNVTVVIGKNDGISDFWTTRLLRFFQDYRDLLFSTLVFVKCQFRNPFLFGFPKVSTIQELQVLTKMFSKNRLVTQMHNEGSQSILVHRIAHYYIKCFDFTPYFKSDRDGVKKSEDYKEYHFNPPIQQYAAAINSTAFYFYWQVFFDAFKAGKLCVESFPFGNPQESGIQKKLISLEQSLMRDMKSKCKRLKADYVATGRVEYDQFYPRNSKAIIDQIDHVLAKHYGFTDEELDFIINYDIKYRMGHESEEQE